MGYVLTGAHARAALGSPMASVVFTRGHLGTTHAADRLRARESTAACMQGRTRVVMGPTCTHPCTRAHSKGRAPCLRPLRRVLLEPSPCVESPGEHEDEGLPYVRERTSRTNRVCAGSPTGEEAGAAIGCSMASTVLLYCPSSLLPHPALLDLARVSTEKVD